MKIGVIGPGEFGLAICQRMTSSGFEVTCGSRQSHIERPRWRSSLPNVDITSIPECILQSHVIFLAVQAEAHASLVAQYPRELANRIVVDVSNPRRHSHESQAERLSRALPASRVVKGFNMLSAEAIMVGSDSRRRDVHLCSDDAEALSIVAMIAIRSGFNAVHAGTLRRARFLEHRTRQLFPAWVTGMLIAFGVSCFWIIFAIVRNYYLKSPSYPIGQLPLNVQNRGLGCVALTLLSLCYIPGALAACVQLWMGSKYVAFPAWLDAWLRSRKQLGILALAFSYVHLLMSVSILDAAYFKQWYVKAYIVEQNGSDSQDNYRLALPTKMNLWGESVIFIGIVAICFMSVLGLASLPSIGDTMNWREWRCIHSYMGVVCLVLATAHVMVKGVPKWVQKGLGSSAQSMSFLSCLVPWCTLMLKAALWIPCVRGYLARIRNGWQRNGSGLVDRITNTDETLV